MTAWSSHSIVACLLLLTACPSEPTPPPAEDSSTGPGESTSSGPGPVTTPTTADTSTSDPDTTAGTSSGPGTSSSSGDPTTDTTGPDETTGSSSGDSSSSGDPGTSSSSGDPGTSSSSGDPSTGSSSGDPTTTGGDPCDAGDGPVFAVTNAGFADYVINGLNDPPLVVVRGCSYTFNVNAAGHPFLIKTVQGTGVMNSYNDGVVGNGAAVGVITWDVSMAAPDALFYNCQLHAPMTGTITVIDP